MESNKLAGNGIINSHTHTLLSLGYKQSYGVQPLFTKSTNTSFIALLVYVDDLVLAGNDMSEISSVKFVLDDRFRIKDLSALRFFLGLEISRSSHGISLNQRKYILDLLVDSGLLAAKPVSMPCDPAFKFTNTRSASFSDVNACRRLIGRLIYLSTTRPDIAYYVQQLSQYLFKPLQSHFQAAIHILRYLKSAPSQRLFFPAANSLQLTGFADSDWACCIDTRKSITRYCVFLSSAIISWKSKKQETVSASSYEAEYRALAKLTREIQWLNYILADLQVHATAPSVLYCDNKSAIHLAHNSTSMNAPNTSKLTAILSAKRFNRVS
ncbi:uncharacterized mitochondrial protein AtMg00810-like [Vicia villosa]|uniref:uncharacterized mitochondrial protein AtMg00810-like n=1 Tax=Vicia villosa TaxID=3911 RepID=UPI00273C56CB|nr:uncharacterized mitochondrial protein AtMg00810-like [Vicia villosa]